ncbi:membrane protein [Mesorhizobium huakuii]|uniref:Right-handed parallel beta-helix repeat-containing protein n=1 Tax=Mesorhizobium huakuii TaxID=28104 RepID=A0ABZ0VMQ8_9HYPH|nr:hypothetical protein [Mesorhizobium huakuii]WQB98734.1 hypothetical protein U0R22_002898 [Mesorhizobium huakuii]GLQ80352.1 membrane protein [Mesorhizobium huakuii]
MKMLRFFFSFAILILASGFLIAPASAQATRTWVSGVGDDANPCSRTAPCKTFAGAISKTAVGGEINVLDPGGFGGVTITKSITIRSDHIEAGVLVSGTNAIVVNAGATGKVVLEGLDIEGLGTGLNGVHILSGQAVYILRCDIRNFTQNGVNSVSSTSGARVFIQDSTINRNGGGVNVQGNGVGNIASLNRVLVDGNTTFALQATNAGNVLAVINSVLNASPSAIILTGGATATSFGPSNVVSGAGAFTTTNPFK